MNQLLNIVEFILNDHN